jgi:RimJ/RimL family protein N-acetyltransferase
MRLETERLILRPWEDRDRAPFAAILADPHVMRFYPATRTLAQANEWIDRIIAGEAADGFHFRAVERKSDGMFLGQAGIGRFDYPVPGNPEVEIGWILAEHAWGQGYAPEAARACLDYGFAVLNLPEIVAFTYRGNLASQRVMQKIGMIRDPAGDFDHPRLPEGHFQRPHVLYRKVKPGI